jgi:hypothetical protein
MIICMATVDRFSITMVPELGDAVRVAAREAGISVSAWLSAAAGDRLRNDLLGAALDEWELEHGSFTDEELERATAALGLGPDEPRRDRPDRGAA